jgi:excisionase family DNA binding protein
METGKYLSRKHAAEWLDVSEKTIDRRCTAGEIKSFKDGGIVRIEIASLEAYAARHGRSNTSPAEAETKVEENPFPIPKLDELRAQKAAERARRAAERRAKDGEAA